ncbi:hypothetical protein E2K98_09110 [Bacillus salipaludis]|uniref:Uncharacterized protein n=1 Tax=Bacillus salipaludis TaxID=2547811 RepID=A0A4R5VTU1_9BACI|nr:cytochrome c3 family protein [Bacillus salipaludis]TDK62210.1 hypothetical protein E2K98_09110 [Bacillus salipaludis]
MKFLNNNKQLNILYIMILVLIYSLTLPIKTDAEDSPPNSPPSILINNVKVEGEETTITGTVSDNQTPLEDITIKLFDSKDQPQLNSPIHPSTDGNWTMKKVLTDKAGTYYIKASDSSIESERYTIKDARLHIKSLSIMSFITQKKEFVDGKEKIEEVTEPVDVMKNDDLTHISLNPTITAEVSNNDALDQLILDHPNQYSPIAVFNKQKQISGDITINTQNQIELKLKDLSPSTTYYILYNSSYVDDEGTPLFPIVRKFTTVSNTVNNLFLYDQKYKSNSGDFKNLSDWAEQPHGYYTNNVNNCSICHSPHYGDNKSLETKNRNMKNLENSYCMACHDGTSAPVFENVSSDIKSKHETQQITDHEMKSGTCTACHNPHLTWSEENPNLLQDHFVYKHEDKDEVDGGKVGEIDSNNQLCEKCHELNSNYYKNLASQLASEKDPYKISHYQRFSAVGQKDNFDLCFTCHNNEKETKVRTKDILQYYQDSDSKHKITAIDGSQLNGYLPCSECHDTHKSTNRMLLKTKLGHEDQDSEPFSFISGDWGASSEREFCLKCHNSKTAIFGVTGKALDDSIHGHKIISEGTKEEIQKDIESKACSNCHGGESKSFIEAAHAPKKSTVSITP